MKASQTEPTEEPVFLDTGGRHLFMIHTRPTGPSNGVGVLLLNGGANKPTAGRNRISTKMMRRYAERGYHGLRLDFHGVGDSTGHVEQLRLDRPFTEDVHAVLAWGREQGIKRFVMLGCCFGARTALACAVDMEDVAGLVLLYPPVRDFGKGASNKRVTRLAREWSGSEYLKRSFSARRIAALRDPEKRRLYVNLFKAKGRQLARRASPSMRSREQREYFWVSPKLTEPLEEMVRRSVPVLLLYGTNDEYLPEFQEARKGPLGRIMAKPSSRITLEIWEGKLVGMGTVPLQEKIIDEVGLWLDSAIGAERG